MLPALSYSALPNECSGHSSSFGSPSECPPLSLFSAVRRDALVSESVQVLFVCRQTRRRARRREGPRASCYLLSVSWWDYPTPHQLPSRKALVGPGGRIRTSENSNRAQRREQPRAPALGR